jgi:hypothetical protein
MENPHALGRISHQMDHARIGALTCTMVYAAIAPQAALRSTFGTTLEGPLAEVLVRNWGALIALVGAMLIRGRTMVRCGR